MRFDRAGDVSSSGFIRRKLLTYTALKLLSAIWLFTHDSDFGQSIDVMIVLFA